MVVLVFSILHAHRVSIQAPSTGSGVRLARPFVAHDADEPTNKSIAKEKAVIGTDLLCFDTA